MIYTTFRAIDLNTTVRVIQRCDQAQLLLLASAERFLPSVVLVNSSQQSHQVSLHSKSKSRQIIRLQKIYRFHNSLHSHFARLSRSHLRQGLAA